MAYVIWSNVVLDNMSASNPEQILISNNIAYSVIFTTGGIGTSLAVVSGDISEYDLSRWETSEVSAEDARQFVIDSHKSVSRDFGMPEILHNSGNVDEILSKIV